MVDALRNVGNTIGPIETLAIIAVVLLFACLTLLLREAQLRIALLQQQQATDSRTSQPRQMRREKEATATNPTIGPNSRLARLIRKLLRRVLDPRCLKTERQSSSIGAYHADHPDANKTCIAWTLPSETRAAMLAVAFRPLVASNPRTYTSPHRRRSALPRAPSISFKNPASRSLSPRIAVSMGHSMLQETWICKIT